MIAAKLNANGRLSDITERPLGAGDVELVAQPTGYGPWTYDAINKLAVPVAPATLLAELIANNRAFAKAMFTDVLGELTVELLTAEGIALVTMDELNILRQWDMSFKAAVAAATNLAELKTAVASLPSLPDRTASQIRPAIRNRIDGIS